MTKGKAKIDQKPKLGYALTDLSSKLVLQTKQKIGTGQQLCFNISNNTFT